MRSTKTIWLLQLFSLAIGTSKVVSHLTLVPTTSPLLLWLSLTLSPATCRLTSRLSQSALMEMATTCSSVTYGHQETKLLSSSLRSSSLPYSLSSTLTRLLETRDGMTWKLLLALFSHGQKTRHTFTTLPSSKACHCRHHLPSPLFRMRASFATLATQ